MAEVQPPVQAPNAEIAELILSFRYSSLTLTEDRKLEIGNIVQEHITHEIEPIHEESRRQVQSIQTLANTLLHEKDGEILRLTSAMVELNQQLRNAKTDFETAQNQVRDLQGNLSTTAWNAIRELRRMVGTERMTNREIGFYIIKTLGEIGLSILEPFAAGINGKAWMRWLGVSMGIMVLIICIFNFCKGLKENRCIVMSENGNKKLLIRRVDWLLVYEVIISIITVILFMISFKTKYSLHLVLYPCVYSFCMSLKEIIRQFSKKDEDFEVIALPEMVKDEV